MSLKVIPLIAAIGQIIHFITKIKNRKDGFLSRFFFPQIMSCYNGISIGSGVKIRGMPIVQISPGGQLTIENNVMLNSINKLTHINLFAPVSLYADGPKSVIHIGEGSRIQGSCIHAKQRIEIGKGCLIASNCQIIDNSGHSLSFPQIQNRGFTIGDTKPVAIGDYVWICANCLILPGVKIGEGSVISAGSVVTETIPSYALARGNPARVIKVFDHNTSNNI